MTEQVAADVYRVAEVERARPPIVRAFFWARTIVAGLIGAEASVPVISDIVLFRGESEVRRLEASSVAELESLLDGIRLELETSTPEQFAASWSLPSPRSRG